MLVSPADRGSVFYREARVSRGRTFDLLKFRTLRADVLVAAGGHARPLEHDPDNLTWSGRRFLKPWYLDELPQLLNVLHGDLSLVGPRPWPPELVERQVADGDDYRTRILAGLTGLDAARRPLDLELAARLLTHLPSQCFLERFAVIDTATGQKPRAGVRAGELAYQEHTPLGVGACDDRREASWSTHGPREG